MTSIKKAVIPAAGKGTRMLSLTNGKPKELLPVNEKPVIDYIVEEAIQSGISEIILIIHQSKEVIRKHLESNSFSKKVKFSFCYQNERKGLGDAVLTARSLVGDKPFALLMGDTIVESEEKPVLLNLCEYHDLYNASVVALEEVELERVSKYGVVKVSPTELTNLYKIEDLVEKPSIEDAPSQLVIASRYVLRPQIFNELERTLPGYNNEIQLTDAMRMMLRSEEIYGFRFEGRRVDVGELPLTPS